MRIAGLGATSALLPQVGVFEEWIKSSPPGVPTVFVSINDQTYVFEADRLMAALDYLPRMDQA